MTLSVFDLRNHPAKADPANYTLTILRSKLDAGRKLADREQQLAADKEKQAQLAAQKAAADKVEADRQAELKAQQAAAEQQRLAAQQRQAQQQQAAEAARQQQANTAPAAAPASDAGTHAAVLVKNTAPRYPTAAMRANQEGWVELSFTITPSGDVSDVKVIDAQPRHVFDRSAIDAVSRWKYQPATQDGTPVASTKRQRIEFKL